MTLEIEHEASASEAKREVSDAFSIMSCICECGAVLVPRCTENSSNSSKALSW